MLSFRPDVEQAINSSGSVRPGPAADVGLTSNEKGVVRVRCYREECRIRAIHDEKEIAGALKKDESIDIPLDSDVELSFR